MHPLKSLIPVMAVSVLMFTVCRKQQTDIKQSKEPAAPVMNRTALLTTAQIVDSVGKLHNQYLADLYTSIVSQHISLNDTARLKLYFKSYTNSYFAARGISTNGFTYPHLEAIRVEYIPVTENKQTLSPQGLFILNQIEYLLQNYNDTTFMYKMLMLKAQALKLVNVNEALAVGIAASVAINSISYWRTNTTKYIIALKESTTPPKKKVNWWSLGAADMSGAFTGAWSGTVLGPGGAFAGAVLGSAWSSLTTLTVQVAASHIGTTK